MTILGALLIVPFALDYLGPERYGVWLTISSFVGLLAFSDLGLGNGLLTAISKSQGRNDEPATKSYVASGFLMLSGAAVALAAAFMIVWSTVDWARVFNLTSEPDALEAGIGCQLSSQRVDRQWVEPALSVIMIVRQDRGVVLSGGDLHGEFLPEKMERLVPVTSHHGQGPKRWKRDQSSATWREDSTTLLKKSGSVG